MKITDTGHPTVVPKSLNSNKSAGKETIPTVQSIVNQGNEAFSVQLTKTAEHTHEPLKTDEVSHDKVAAIRDQLAAGTYRISGKDIANKILRSLKS
jgi:flagellar biosynthesis anti-sigma factor FlgM